MNGKKVLITGATAGLGKVTARELAKRGAHVIIVGRNPDKTVGVQQELIRDTGNQQVDYLLADLSKLDDVKKLARDYIEKFGTLDVLINNAGGVNLTRERTVDGFELTFAVNHLAYFVLSNLLVPAIVEGGRIINLASSAHNVGFLDFDDLMAERFYNPWLVYGRSKLANILFTHEMAKRVEKKKITVNSVHPGFVASDFLKKGGIWKVIQPVGYLFALSPDAGAETTVYLACSQEVAGITGKYFHKRRQARTARRATDDVAARRLWEVSEKLTGVDTAAYKIAH